MASNGRMSEQSRTPAVGGRRAPVSVVFLVTATVGVAQGCASCETLGERAPRGVTPGLRIPGADVSTAVKDWTFAAGEKEIWLETRVPWGRHSVTVWSVVVNGRLYIATDKSGVLKLWVRQLERDPEARVGIHEHVYHVRANRVLEPDRRKVVLETYAKKYGAEFLKHDFPKPEDTTRGRIYELESRS